MVRLFKVCVSIIICSVLFGNSGYSQGLKSGTNFYIESGVTLYVKNDMSNDAGGTIHNSGVIRLTGGFNNSGTPYPEHNPQMPTLLCSLTIFLRNARAFSPFHTSLRLCSKTLPRTCKPLGSRQQGTASPFQLSWMEFQIQVHSLWGITLGRRIPFSKACSS